MTAPSETTHPWPIRWLRDVAGLDAGLEVTRWLFLRGLGGIYLAAFISLASQIPSFHGSEGLISTADRMERIAQANVEGLFWKAPSLFWLDASDHFLLATGWCGVGFAVLVILNVGTRWLLPVLWALYLSFVNVGEPFFPFQWDQLLLETGFLATFIAIPRRASLILIWLLRWLAFRLMLMNGLVKVIGVDPTYLDGTTSPWRDGSALKYHYETQPLPTAAAWYFHHAPLWFHQFSTCLIIFVELVVPFFIFLGRWPRLVAAIFFAGIHVMILITGSHAFYNWLSLVIFIPLLDDRFYRFLFSKKCMAWLEGRGSLFSLFKNKISQEAPPNATGSRVPRWVSPVVWGVFAALFVAISIGASAGMIYRRPAAYPGWVRDWASFSSSIAQPWRITSGYGAFGQMTRQRPEVVIAGSDNGVDWKEYGLCYKPTRLDRAPNLAAPHHPRLDWQLWFTALGQPSPWLVGVAQGLLTDKPSILRMVCEDPFPEKPPRYVRFILYRYQFTTSEEAAETGHWWKREFLDFAGPVLTLNAEGRLTAD